MDTEQVGQLVERIERLEAIVAALQRPAAAAPGPVRPPRHLAPAPSATPGPGPEVAVTSRPLAAAETSPNLSPVPPPRPPRPFPTQPQPTRLLATGLESVMTAEFWMNKIGVALLLFGLGFLFKYAVDRGWLTEPVRVAFGLAVGTALLGAGVRLYGRHRHFSQVLIGGSLGAYYLTGFAAYQLFHLVDYWIAFGFMIAVTGLAFALALRLDGAVLALIGAAGGLATPFLLYSTQRNIPGLVLYTGLMLAGIGAAYLYRGWRSLLWLGWVGGWAILLLAELSVPGGLLLGYGFDHPPSADRWAVQAGIAFGWLLFGIVPVLREALWTRNPARWPRPALESVGALLGENLRQAVNAHVGVMISVTPFLALLLTTSLWSQSGQTWGALLLGGAALYALAYGIWRRWVPGLDYVHLMLGVAFLTLAWLLLLEGNVLFLTLAVQSVTLLYCARRFQDRGTAVAGHLIAAGLAIGSTYRLIGGGEGAFVVFNAMALTDLAIIGLALGAATLVQSCEMRRLYRLAGYAALAAWLTRELGRLPDGRGYVLIGWALLAVVLLYLAPRLEDQLTDISAQLLLLMTGALLAERLAFSGSLYPAFLNVRGLQNATVILLALGATWLIRPRQLQILYRLGVHGAILAWLWRELLGLENGNAYITVAWGSYAVALLVAGLARDRHPLLLNFGLGTLFLVVGKLFLVDIVWLDSLWRILLFLGFGGLFLGISYTFQRLFRSAAHPHPGQAD